jgi:hypothetical protein
MNMNVNKNIYKVLEHVHKHGLHGHEHELMNIMKPMNILNIERETDTDTDMDINTDKEMDMDINVHTEMPES